MSATKPFIGITLGDYNGIGPEVILKALGSQRILKWCTPVIYGSQQVIKFYRKQLELQDWSIKSIASMEEAIVFAVYIPPQAPAPGIELRITPS